MQFVYGWTGKGDMKVNFTFLKIEIYNYIIIELYNLHNF